MYDVIRRTNPSLCDSLHVFQELEGTKSQLQVAMEINKTLEAKPKVCGCTCEHVFM